MSKNWISYDFDNGCFRDVLYKAGVYVVYGNDEIIYIGSSNSIRKRITSYSFNYCKYSCPVKTPWGNYLKLKLKARYTKKYGEWAMIELRLIRRLQPKHNKTSKGKGKNGR